MLPLSHDNKFNAYKYLSDIKEAGGNFEKIEVFTKEPLKVIR